MADMARDRRWKRPYTELTYVPMIEVLGFMRANGYKTYILTGGEKVYEIAPEQVVGTAGGTSFGYDKQGKPLLTKDPKPLLNDDNAEKPEGIHLMIGRQPYAAFGNSAGDLANAGVHKGDAEREYAYGPAPGCPMPRWEGLPKHCTTRPSQTAGSLTV